ncbi:hypothetical protein CAP36_00305 [Chitinophagaceae bacterium IBVUCB2]|nr:hypothetical protein CAP36_00305 [Chitinophagaceae bacterium IBVUCB2]
MQKRLYNLDGLRFLAALIVVICHLEIFKTYFNLKASSFRFFTNSAQLAVTFFFVLSGFLITYLLLIEKKKSQSQHINLLSFYKKRALRIWPLYYLLVVLAFFVLNKSSFLASNFQPIEETINTQRLLGYTFFLPNYTQLQYGGQGYLGQVWSLGVEEFFYLFFPLAIYFIPLKNIRRFLVLLIILFFILSIGIHFVNNHEYLSGKWMLPVYLDRYRIYSFAAGGFAASLLVLPLNKPISVLALLSKRLCSIFLMIVLAFLIGTGITFSIFTQQAYSLLFAVFIYSITVTEIRFSFLNHSLVVYLGKISYGLYMLHPIATVFVLKVVPGDPSSAFYLYVLLPIAIVGCTILLAALSYELFEKYFLKLARKRVVEDPK